MRGSVRNAHVFAKKRAVDESTSSTTTEVVLAQRGAGGRDVHDALGHAGERRELDVAVQLHDLHLNALARIVGLRDVGVLRGHADGPERAAVLVHRRGRAGRLGHHEAARAELQVHQLHHVGIGFQKRVLAADAAVGRPQRHEHGRVGRADDDVLDARAPDDELPPGIVQPLHVQACRPQRLHGVRVERALGHRDAQGLFRRPVGRRNRSRCQGLF